MTTIQVPIVELRPNVYCRQHVDVQLTLTQAQKLRRIHDALEARGDLLANGKQIRSAADAVRWVIEQA